MKLSQLIYTILNCACNAVPAFKDYHYVPAISCHVSSCLYEQWDRLWWSTGAASYLGRSVLVLGRLGGDESMCEWTVPPMSYYGTRTVEIMILSFVVGTTVSTWRPGETFVADCSHTYCESDECAFLNSMM